MTRDSRLEDSEESMFHTERGMALELDKIREDLKTFRVSFDVFSSELKIRSNSAVEKEIEYLKSIGLLNNDRCPLCGSSIHGNPGRFTDGYNSSLHFQICQNCVSNGRRMSDNPANKGCIIAILLLPLSLLKLSLS